MQSASSVILGIARHKVCANVIMVVFVLAGLLAINSLQTRFFPEFAINVAAVSASHSGVNAEEIQSSIIVPLENELRDLTDLDTIQSTSKDGSGTIRLGFPGSADITQAFEDTKTRITRVDIPSGAKKPQARLLARKEQVMIMTVAVEHRHELRRIARGIEKDLRSRNIARIEITGIPEEQIEILVDQNKLVELGLTIEELGTTLREENKELTVGSQSGLGSTRTLRGGRENSEFHELYRIPIAATQSATPVYLRDIAFIQKVLADDQTEVTHNGKPAASFELINTGDKDILDTAKQLYAWRDQIQSRLPDTVDIIFHDEDWSAVKARLSLLLDNGISGLCIVLGILFLLLSFPVAIWVAVGIPIAMFGTLFVFDLAGGSINMISMFALIMAVGIIVDDAIVVGENAQYRLSQGVPPLRAVTSAAHSMFVPVFASSFTTIASFLPLFLISGTIGAIIFDIPLIIVCILIAALLECFFILPGHLYHTFSKLAHTKPNRFRAAINRGFDYFREKIFRPVVTFATRHALATCTACFMLLALAAGLMINGLVAYRFFPGAEGNKVHATVTFRSGTEHNVTKAFVNDSIALLTPTEQNISAGNELIRHVSALYNDETARVIVELVDPDLRDVTTREFANHWRRAVGTLPPSVERLTINSSRRGPPSEDLEILLTGSDINSIKLASEQLQEVLAEIPGTSSIGDDTAYGNDQYIFELTTLGRSLGLDINSIARQLRFALDGFQVQTFNDNIDETKLKILFTDNGHDVLTSTFIRLPNRQFVQLSSLVTWHTAQGFNTILRKEGLTAITVNAVVDDDAPLSPGQIIDQLKQQLLPELAHNYGIGYTFEGSQSRHEDALRDITYGLYLALVLIFITLTLVFRSWTLPIVVMITMPLGIIGALFGHWVLGLSMSILSFFGMFTLMGIIVNNSIVLVRCFQDIAPAVTDKVGYNRAIVDAACLRLRSVLLTTLTTIGGLMPLMFENSLQAQFLIPMAASIVFGLAFASILILIFTPACITIHGSCSRMFIGLKASPVPFRISAH